MEDDEPDCPRSERDGAQHSSLTFLVQYTAPRRPIVLNAMIGQARYHPSRHASAGVPVEAFSSSDRCQDYSRRRRYEHILVTIIRAISDTMASRGVGSGYSGDIPLVEADIT